MKFKINCNSLKCQSNKKHTCIKPKKILRLCKDRDNTCDFKDVESRQCTLSEITVYQPPSAFTPTEPYCLNHSKRNGMTNEQIYFKYGMYASEFFEKQKGKEPTCQAMKQ
jgi:hypothetical protein